MGPQHAVVSLALALLLGFQTAQGASVELVTNATDFLRVVRSLTGSTTITVPAGVRIDLPSVNVSEYPPVAAPGFIDSGQISIVAHGEGGQQPVLDFGSLQGVSVSRVSGMKSECKHAEAVSTVHT